MKSETIMKSKRNRSDIGAKLNRSETENPPPKPPYQPLGWSYGKYMGAEKTHGTDGLDLHFAIQCNWQQ